jgi:beta-lactamase regulating signal transducer with metallopeptidase domain
MTGLGDNILLWLGAYALHSTLFLAGVWLIERLWKRATPALLSTLWRTALLAGIATATLQASGIVSPAAGRLAILPAIEAPPSPVTALEIAQPSAPAPATIVEPPQPAPSTAEAAALEPATVQRTAFEPVTTSSGNFTLDWSPDWSLIGAILLYIWAGIAALLAVRGATMWLAAYRELRDRQPVVQGPLFERIQALAHDIGLRRLPQVSFSERIAGPFTLPNGEICVPVWARERLPDRQLDAMLAHEMAHVLHRDSLWLAIGMGVSTLFFFQPLNLVARRRMANLAELSADDWAATRAGSGRPLAECISTFVDIAHARASAIATPEFAAAMAKPKSELVQRVERLLNNRYTTGVLPMKTKLLVGACALAFAAVMPGLAAQAHDQPAPLLAPAPPLAPESPAAPGAAAAPEAPRAAEELEGAAALAAPAWPEAPPALEAMAAPAAVPAPDALAAPAAASVPDAPAVDPAPAPQTQRNVSSSRTIFGERDITVQVHKPFDYRLNAKIRGDVDLAPDGSGVSRLGGGSHLDATLDKGGVVRRVRYTSEGGAIQRQFWVGSQSRAWSSEADAFVAELMPILFRETGLNTKERVDWFLQRRGPDALFAEIGLIDSDAVQTGYINRWAETTTLAPPMFERVMALAGAQIDSDAHLQAALDKAYTTQHPKGRQIVELLKAGKSIDSDAHAYAVLEEAAPDALAADDTAGAWFDLARTVASDAHMEAALSRAVGSASISDARVADIIRLAGNDIDSDAHLDAVLRASARRVGAADDLARVYLGAVRSIDSDAHAADALEVLSREARLSPIGWRGLMEAASHIGSDAHKSAVLDSVAAHVGSSDDLARAYIASARTIDSDAHAAHTLGILAREARLSPAGWRDLIDASVRIGSDAHKSGLLVSVAGRMPRDTGVVSAYHAATDSIGSNAHRDAAERALR